MNCDEYKYFLLSEFAPPPSRGTPEAAGYDLKSAYDYVVPKRGLLLTPYEAAKPPPKIYEQRLLENNIQFRLLKKDWKPQGPSAETDEVMEEYQWGVTQAFRALLKSSWEFESVPAKEVEKLFKSGNYNKDQDTIVIIHPMLASADSSFVKTTITALAMRNLHKQYNILALHMPSNNPQMIYTVIKTLFGKHTYFEPMAKAVSEFLVAGIDNKYLKPEKIHLVGWSYSGQLVGYVARYLGAKYETKIASIVALDPYAIYLNEKLISVSADDARVVHVFHSNSFVAGTRERVGTADLVFNSGNVQPECELFGDLDITIQDPTGCSHFKVVQRFWYVILYPSKFLARRCPTWNHLKDCFCEGNPLETISYPIRPDSQAKGIYFLRTLDTKPYGLGKRGVSCSSKKRLFMEINKGKNPET